MHISVIPIDKRIINSGIREAVASDEGIPGNGLKETI